MADPLREFSSSDSGAPVWNGVISGGTSGVDVLYSVLVQGYGAVAPAGWTAPVTRDSNTIVIRPAPVGSESPPYYRFTKDSANNVIVLEYFETLPGLTGGTPHATRYWFGTGLASWRIYANSKTAYLFLTWNLDGPKTFVMILGRVRTYSSDFAARWVCHGGGGPSYALRKSAVFVAISSDFDNSSIRSLRLFGGGQAVPVLAAPEACWATMFGSSFSSTIAAIDFYSYSSSSPFASWITTARPFFFGPEQTARIAPVLLWGPVQPGSPNAPVNAALPAVGELPGLFAVSYGGGLAPGDIVEGTGIFSGRSWRYELSHFSASMSAVAESSTSTASQGMLVELTDNLVY